MSVQTSDSDLLLARLQIGSETQAWAAMLDTLATGDGSGLAGVLLPSDIGTSVQAWSSILDTLTSGNLDVGAGGTISTGGTITLGTNTGTDTWFDGAGLFSLGGGLLSVASIGSTPSVHTTGIFDADLGLLGANLTPSSSFLATDSVGIIINDPDPAGSISALMSTIDLSGNAAFASLFDGSGGNVLSAAQTIQDFSTFFQVQAYSINGSNSDFLQSNGDGGNLTGIFNSDTAHVVLGDGTYATVASITSAGKLVTNAAPTTGQTVNAAGVNQDELIYIQPAGTLLALTIQLEPGGGATSDIGDVKEIFISQIITGLTVSATGGTVRGTALTTSSAVNGSYEYIKVTSTDWLRIR